MTSWEFSLELWRNVSESRTDRGASLRIAFSSQPIYSHLVPAVLPLARAAADEGHEVTVLTSPGLADEVRRFGLTPLPLAGAIAPAELMGRPELVERIGADPSDMADFGRRTVGTSADNFARLFAGPLAGDFATEALAALDDFAPDLVVREGTDYGGYYTAEHLGVPNASLDISPLAPHDAPEVLEQVNTQRKRLDLGDVRDPTHPFRHRRIGLAPSAFYPARQHSPSARYHHPAAANAEPLDPVLADLPGDRPLVLATLGSTAARLHDQGPSLLDTIVEVLGDLPVTGVVALGRGVDPDGWQGARPENVHLASFVQQQLLLPACDAFVTHAGFSGTREALSAGVPMVSVPMFAEQPANAARVEELGVGLRLNVEDVTHESLGGSLRELLDDPRYRYRARGMQRRFLALPAFERIVPELAELLG